MLAVGEHKLGYVSPQMIRLTTGLSGGIGCGHQDLCGAVSAGVMVIGAVHGRTQPGVDDSLCQVLSAQYRDRFVEAFQSTRCETLRELHPSCKKLVEQAVLILLETLTAADDSSQCEPS